LVRSAKASTSCSGAKDGNDAAEGADDDNDVDPGPLEGVDGPRWWHATTKVAVSTTAAAQRAAHRNVTAFAIVGRVIDDGAAIHVSF
jgi:hypothetical protein